MKRITFYKFSILLLLVAGLSSFVLRQSKPTLFLIGDSTVRNGRGDGGNGQWGWGSFIHELLDTNRVSVNNAALGGTSSRTYYRSEKLWGNVLAKIKKGDMVMMQFGHNDGGPLDDTARARGTIRGTGNEQREIYNPITKQQEVVHSYGWYLTNFIKEAQAKGAVVFVCSPVPRNNWSNGKMATSAESYPLWAKQSAEKNGVYYIDLSERLEQKYNQLGKEAVDALFPANERTHTNLEGAKLNARTVLEAVSAIKGNPLTNYIRQ